MFSSTPQGKAPGLSSEACSSGSPGDLLNTAPHIESSLPLPNRYLKGEDSLFLLPDSALRAVAAACGKGSPSKAGHVEAGPPDRTEAGPPPSKAHRFWPDERYHER